MTWVFLRKIHLWRMNINVPINSPYLRETQVSTGFHKRQCEKWFPTVFFYCFYSSSILESVFQFSFTCWHTGYALSVFLIQKCSHKSCPCAGLEQRLPPSSVVSDKSPFIFQISVYPSKPTHPMVHFLRASSQRWCQGGEAGILRVLYLASTLTCTR